MKSKFLKCLSVGITSAMLAASIIPISAPTAFAEATKDFNDFYWQYKLPDHASAMEPGQGETYYAIFQIAKLDSYDAATGFAAYEFTQADLLSKDAKKDDLFKVDDQGRIMYSTETGSWKLLDESSFSGGDNVTMGGVSIHHDLLGVLDRAAEKIRQQDATTIKNATYTGEIQKGKYYDDAKPAGEKSNPTSWTEKQMYKLGHTTEVRLKNGLYIMLSIGPKIQTPNLIAVANYNEAAPSGFKETLQDKGSNITLNKTITNVEGDVEDGGKIGANGDSAEVAVGSIVTYQLDSITPIYDTAVTEAISSGTKEGLTIPTDLKDGTDDGIIDYVIYDDPSKALEIQFDRSATLGLTIQIGDSANAATTNWEEISDANLSAFDGYYTLDEILKVSKCTFNASNFSTTNKVVNSASNHIDHIHGGEGFKIVFTDKFITDTDYMNKAVRVTFKAKVTATPDSSKDIGTDKMLADGGKVKGFTIPNEGIVQYDNQFLAGSRSASTYSDTVKAYRVEIAVNKVDGDTNATVQGAKFAIYDKTGLVQKAGPKTITSNGYVTFNELPAGTYTLRETDVPSGYKKIEDIKFTIAADTDASGYNGKYTLTAEGASFEVGQFSGVPSVYGTDVTNALNIKHYKGQTLPGTGGMGTVIFTVVGAGIIVLAGVLLVIYMKKRRVDEE